jgi:hypothetical protein
VSPQTVEKCGCGFDSLPEYERGAQKEALRRKRKKERERRPVRAEYKKTAGGRGGKILGPSSGGSDAGGKGFGSFVSGRVHLSGLV